MPETGEHMSTIIGIDLGTSTTEAAVIQNGKPLMIFNLENEIQMRKILRIPVILQTALPGYRYLCPA